MGVCENVVTKAQRCAIQASDCVPSHIDGSLNVEGEKWYTAHDQRLNGNAPCDCGETEINACMNGDSFTCSPTKSGYCSSSSDLYGIAPTEKGYCTCDSQFVDNVRTRTKYGACQDLTSSKSHFCAYSPKDCEDNHIWVEPELAKDIVGTDCFCENVRIGGCIGGFTNFICAVTEDQCYFDKYYPPHSLKELFGQTCTLCKADIEIIDELTDLPVQEKKKSGKSGLSSGGVQTDRVCRPPNVMAPSMVLRPRVMPSR